MATLSPLQLLGDILSRANVASGDTERGIETVRSNTAKTEESFRNDATLQRSTADAAALVTSTQQLGRLQVEESLRRTAAQFGADLIDATGLQAELSGRYIAARKEQRDALDVIQKKQAVSLFENPIEYLLNQFTIDSDIQRHNAANAKAQQAAGQLDETNKLLDARAVAANRLQTTVTQASAEAAAQVAKNNALILANDYERRGILANTQGVKDIINLRVSDMQIAAARYDAVVKQENLKNAQAQLTLSREAASRDAERLLMQQKSERRAEAAEGRAATLFEQEQAGRKYIQDAIVLGYQKLFPDQPEKWEVPNSPRMIGLMSGKIPLDGELKTAFELGVVNSKADPAGRTRILGTSPIDTLKNLQYRPSLNAEAKVTVSLMTDAAQAATQSAQYKAAVAAKDVETANKLVNDAINRAFAEAAVLVKDPSNPYYLPNISTIVSQSPDLKRAVDAGEFPAYAKIVQPLVAAGVDTSNPNLIFSALVKSIQEGKVPLNQAAIEIATIYKQGQRVNIESKQMTGLGIAPLEQYNVKIGTGGLTDDTVNLASPTEIIRAVMKMQRYTGVGLGGTVAEYPSAPVPFVAPSASGVVTPARP